MGRYRSAIALAAAGALRGVGSGGSLPRRSQPRPSDLGLSFYASHFGSYDRTYGSLGAVAVLLVWLYVTAYVILAGAELNREIGQAEDQAERHLQRQNARTGVPPAPKKGARPQK
jgi:hypothetical protein